LVENTNRNNMKKKTVQISQKYNSGRFQYSSQEGNPNYSSLSNSDMPDEKASNRNRVFAVNYHQQRKGKSKTSKGYYKSTNEKSDRKSTSKSKKRKVSKRTRTLKNPESAQTPMSMSKITKNNRIQEFTTEGDSVIKSKRKRVQPNDSVKHHKNASDNSAMYTSHSCGPNIKELIDPKAAKNGTTGIQPSYSPYVSNNNNRKSSHRSKSTNPHVVNTQQSKLNCSEGFVNIDLSLLPHDMTQREVVETMIRKHEKSSCMYSDEDEDTSRYIIQNPDDRRTCRRSQHSKKNDMIESLVNIKESKSPIEYRKKIILGSKSNSIEYKTATIETNNEISSSIKEYPSQDLITEEVIEKMFDSMQDDLNLLSRNDSSKGKSNTKSQDEKKFFLYCNKLEELSLQYPKLKDFLGTIKEGFQVTIRNFISNKVEEEGNPGFMTKSNNFIVSMLKIKMQKQFIDRGIKLEKQEEIIENKDDIILSLQEDNSHLQAVLEKHRINGMELQEENEQLKIEMEKLRKIEQELIDR